MAAQRFSTEGSASARCYGHARRTLCLILLMFGASSAVHAQSALTVSTDFEGGSAQVLGVDSTTRTIRIAPGGNADQGWVCWWSIRIEHATAGQPLTIELTPSEQPTRNQGKLSERPLGAGWSMPARAAISHDGQSWLHSAPAVREMDRIRYEVVPQGTTLWMAWGPPFTPRNTIELLARAEQKIPGAKQFELARTRGDRPVAALRIRNNSDMQRKRPGVWIQARQHAWESGSSWVAQGLVEWLMSDEESARWLTQNAEVVIVPIMDVDNVATGNGGKEENPRDHNRDWDDKPVFPEVAAAQQHLRQWAAESRLDFFIDLHNPAPANYRPFFFTGPPELLGEQGRDNQTLFLAISQKHIAGPLAVEPEPRITGPSYHPLWRQISGQWVHEHGNPHTLAICLETSWNTPSSTTEGYSTVGRQLGETIVEYLHRRKQ